MRDFLKEHPIEVILVFLILLFTIAAVHLLWFGIRQPDNRLIAKGFEAFIGLDGTALGALVMKLTPYARAPSDSSQIGRR